jgi:hypothetical protein
MSGLALLAASFAAGKLWDHYGPSAAFAAGGALATIGLLGTLFLKITMRPKNY